MTDIDIDANRDWTGRIDTKTVVERTAQAIARRHIGKLTGFDGSEIADELYDQAETAERHDISKALEASDNTAEIQAVRERLEQIVAAIREGLPALAKVDELTAELAKGRDAVVAMTQTALDHRTTASNALNRATRLYEQLAAVQNALRSLGQAYADLKTDNDELAAENARVRQQRDAQKPVVDAARRVTTATGLDWPAGFDANRIQTEAFTALTDAVTQLDGGLTYGPAATR